MKKHKWISMLVAGMLALLFGSAPIIETEAQRHLPSNHTAVVYFASPIELDTAMREMKQYNLTVRAFRRQYKLGSHTITDEYILTDKDKNQLTPILRGEYWRSYGAMLEDIYSDSTREFQHMDLNRLNFIRYVKDALRRFSSIKGCWRTDSCPALYVTSMLVLGAGDALSMVSTSEIVARVEVQERTQRGSFPETKTKTNTSELIGPAYVSPSTWVPSRGDIYIHPSSYPGQRYITNWMKWNDVSGFGANSTYEHDFFLNDSDNSKYGPGTYLTDAETWGRIPDVSYWSSNLPRPYLDSRLFDPDYQKAYTVGCSDAASIEPGTWYYTYIRANNGDANIDNGALIPELGHRSPSWCYESTWCVEGDQHEYIYSPWRVDPIPGDFYWTYP